MRRIFLTVCTLLLTAAAPAQQPAAEAGLASEEDAEIRRYTVELIVFRYAEDVSVGTEIFVPDIVEIAPLDPLPETDPLEPEPAVNAGEMPDRDDNLFEMQLLTENELTLTDTYDRLDRLDAYEPLMHVGWTQTALPQESTPFLDLREFGRPPADLDGSFTLYLSRFLHLVVELALDAPDAERRYGSTAPRFEQPQERYAESRDYPPGYPYDEPQYEPLRFRIGEDRLFKNGETRYFDHPKFGVVAKVVRVEEPEEEEQPDDTAFLSPAAVGN